MKCFIQLRNLTRTHTNDINDHTLQFVMFHFIHSIHQTEGIKKIHDIDFLAVGTPTKTKYLQKRTLILQYIFDCSMGVDLWLL